MAQVKQGAGKKVSEAAPSVVELSAIIDIIRDSLPDIICEALKTDRLVPDLMGPLRYVMAIT